MPTRPRPQLSGGVFTGVSAAINGQGFTRFVGQFGYKDGWSQSICIAIARDNRTLELLSNKAMEPTRDSSLPPPKKRQRQRQSCPRCFVSLSKSSFYEHVAQCCPESSAACPPEHDLSDSSFELDEGESEEILHSK